MAPLTDFEKVGRKINYLNNIFEKLILKEVTQITKSELNCFSAEMNRREADIKELVDRIENLETENEYFDETMKMEETLMSLRCNIQTKLDAISDEVSENIKRVNDSHDNAKLIHSTKLPILSLLSFNGDLESYLNFWEIYHSNIDSRKDVSDVDKFQYFLSVLKGEPYHFAKKFTMSSEGYKTLLREFDLRYRKTDDLVYLHLDQILRLPHIKKKNAMALKNLVSDTKTALHNLDLLNQPVGQWDAIVGKIIIDKLDPESLEKWKMSRNNHDIPPLSELLAFIEKIADSTVKETRPNQAFAYTNTVEKNKPKIFCHMCSKPHWLSKCYAFLKLNHSEKLKKISSFRLCQNCLSSKHPIALCTSQRRCFKCGQKHHSSIHKEDVQNVPIQVQSEQAATESKITNFSSYSNSYAVLLATAIIYVIDENNIKYPARILLDSGSQCTTISKEFANKLQSMRKKVLINISGIGNKSSYQAKQSLNIKFTSMHDDSIKYETSALILDQLTANLPENSFSIHNLDYLKGLTLADPNFNQSSPIDIILGGSTAFDILFSGGERIDGPVNCPSVIKTSLGWILMGNYGDCKPKSGYLYSNVVRKNPPQDLISKIREIEDISTNQKIISPDDKLCEELFSKSIHQLPSGKYSIDLMFKEFPPKLDDSLPGAIKRFHVLEKKKKKKKKIISKLLTKEHFKNI